MFVYCYSILMLLAVSNGTAVHVFPHTVIQGEIQEFVTEVLGNSVTLDEISFDFWRF